MGFGTISRGEGFTKPKAGEKILPEGGKTRGGPNRGKESWGKL